MKAVGTRLGRMKFLTYITEIAFFELQNPLSYELMYDM